MYAVWLKMRCLSKFNTVFSKIVLVNEKFVVKSGVERVKKGSLLDTKEE